MDCSLEKTQHTVRALRINRKRTRMNRLLAIIACLNVVSALVTIGYYSKDSGSVLVNGNAKFNRVPDSVQVADLFARVSGNHPLSNEGI